MSGLENTQELMQLFAVAADERSGQWVARFQDVVVDASLTAHEDQVIRGPDGFPYFALYLPTRGEPFTPFSVSHILEYCTDQGYGIAIEPAGDPPGWAFTYGTLWALRARGRFIWDSPTGTQTEELKEGEEREVRLGAPDDVLMPPWARATLRRYLQGVGIETPMVTVMEDPTMNPDLNVIFNVDPSGFAEIEHFHGFMQHLSWFLPPYLPLLHIDTEGGGPQANYEL